MHVGTRAGSDRDVTSPARVDRLAGVAPPRNCPSICPPVRPAAVRTVAGELLNGCRLAAHLGEARADDKAFTPESIELSLIDN